jgi:RsiW-degrading membrane proteinase PrsW (M82 family)
MIIAYSAVALFGSWIWFRYYKLIDVFERENNAHLLISFILGALSVYPVILFGSVVGKIYFEEDGTAINDFFYAFIEVGLVEESAKVLAFGISWFFVRKHLNEPLDYIFHISIVALGFSTVENVLYFNNHGTEIINARIVMSSFGHIFDTSVFAYGLIYANIYQRKYKVFLVPAFLLLAALAHGIYDFLVIHDFPFNILLFIIYFFAMVSMYSTVLNNALNLSPFFTYAIVVHPQKVLSRLLGYYAILLVLQFLLLWYDKDLGQAITKMAGGLIYIGLIMMVILNRLSRFKLIQNKWKRLSLGMPFGVRPEAGLRFRIHGDGPDEADVAELYGRPVMLCPLSYNATELGHELEITLEQKLFLLDEEVYYKVSLQQHGLSVSYSEVYLKAKTFETTKARDQYPIVAVLYPKENGLQLEERTFHDFEFVEWAYLKEREPSAIIAGI